MPLQIVVLPEAESDIRSAAAWYETQQPGLSGRFKQQLSKAIDSIANSKLGFGSVHMNLSRVFVKYFPYTIYFKEDLNRNRLVIYAVLHDKQNKAEQLKKRI